MSVKFIPSMLSYLFTEQITRNMTDYLQWELIKLGAFTTTTNGVLTLASEPGTTAGTVWYFSTDQLVWQSSVPYTRQPVQITSVRVNNVARTTGFVVDYIRGRLVFNTPIATTSVVTATYSYNRYHFYDADQPWYQDIVMDPSPLQTIDDTLKKNRVYLPCVVVQVPAGRSLEGYQLGGYDMEIRQSVLFDIIAKDKEDRDKLLDLLTYGIYFSSIDFYDANKVADADAFPLAGDGSISTGGSTRNFDYLSQNYTWKRVKVESVRSDEITRKLPYFRGAVSATLKTYIP